MKGFMKFYRWGTLVKYHMSLYAMALIFFKGICQALAGADSIGIWTLLEMLMVSFAFAVVEYAIFPCGREFQHQAMKTRTALWAVTANVFLIGGSLVFQWFAGVPAWGVALLIVGLEGGLAAMWIAMHIALEKDTRLLNEGLKEYQSKG